MFYLTGYEIDLHIRSTPWTFGPDTSHPISGQGVDCIEQDTDNLPSAWYLRTSV